MVNFILPSRFLHPALARPERTGVSLFKELKRSLDIERTCLAKSLLRPAITPSAWGDIVIEIFTYYEVADFVNAVVP